MRPCKIMFIIFCLAAPMFAASANPNSLVFSNIALQISPHGINAARGIVGDFCCGTDDQGDLNFIAFMQGHGPLAFLMLLPSGAVTSYATGINGSGTVVGGYCLAALPCAELVGEHGYAFTGTGLGGPFFTQIDYPGAASTTADGINGTGVIVGTYCDSQAACGYYDGDHGFMDSSGVFTAINVPGATMTSAQAINDSSRVVGTYNSGSQDHAFLLSGGVYTTIDPPGAIFAEAEGINNSGEVVGTYLDGSSHEHGFTYLGGVFTTIDAPGSIATSADGIDDQGEIVGTYQVASGAYYGYGAKSH